MRTLVSNGREAAAVRGSFEEDMLALLARHQNDFREERADFNTLQTRISLLQEVIELPKVKQRKTKRILQRQPKISLSVRHSRRWHSHCHKSQSHFE